MESDEDTENEQEQPVMVYETDPTNRYEKVFTLIFFIDNYISFVIFSYFIHIS